MTQISTVPLHLSSNADVTFTLWSFKVNLTNFSSIVLSHKSERKKKKNSEYWSEDQMSAFCGAGLKNYLSAPLHYQLGCPGSKVPLRPELNLRVCALKHEGARWCSFKNRFKCFQVKAKRPVALVMKLCSTGSWKRPKPAAEPWKESRLNERSITSHQ